MNHARSSISMTAFALCAFAVLVALGVWQLERRTWKNALIARFEAGLSGAPATYEPGASEFSHVSVKGEFLNSGTMKVLTPTPEALRGKTQEGFGYQLFTPLRFTGGTVFVNRGFVPQSLAEDLAPPEGPAEITGIVRLTAQSSWFTPPPESAKHLYFDADISAMAAAAALKDGKAIETEYIQAEPLPGAPEWPQPRDLRELLASIPNRHLEYVFTWFGLAATLAGVYIAYMLRR